MTDKYPGRYPQRLYEFNSQKLTLGQWSRQLNIPKGTLDARLRNGWSIERAFSPSQNTQKKQGGTKFHHAAYQHATILAPLIQELRNNGATLQATADNLNDKGYRSTNGNLLRKNSIIRALELAAKQPPVLGKLTTPLPGSNSQRDRSYELTIEVAQKHFWEDKLSPQEIADDYGVPVYKIYRLLSKSPGYAEETGKRRVQRRKIDHDLAHDMYRNRISILEIAETFKCTCAAVLYCLRFRGTQSPSSTPPNKQN
jgi:uncharacterized protein (DUF433 family)